MGRWLVLASLVGALAGAASAPLACMLMGLALFGGHAGVHLGASLRNGLPSGHHGICASQVIGPAKHPLLGRRLGER